MRKSPVDRGLCLAFFLFFLFAMIWQKGEESDNPKSRMATLAALKEGKGFDIGPDPMSIDWARTPDGTYYSNKAPSAAVLSFPFYWLVDTWLQRGPADLNERNFRRGFYFAHYDRTLSFLVQALPWALLCLWLVQISTGPAWLPLGALLHLHFWLQRRYVAAGLFAGLAVATD